MLKKGREAGGALDRAAGGSICSSVSLYVLTRLLMAGVLTLLALPYAFVLTDQRRRDALTTSAGFPFRKPGLLPGFTCDWLGAKHFLAQGLPPLTCQILFQASPASTPSSTRLTRHRGAWPGAQSISPAPWPKESKRKGEDAGSS